MKQIYLLIFLTATVVLGIYILKQSKLETDVQGVKYEVENSEQSDSEILQSQSKPMGAVEVEVTPSKLEPGKEMVFELSFNTHSVDLSYDFTKLIRAEDESGNVYGVTDWTGGNGGHHLRGTVELEALSNDAKKVILIVKGIDDAEAEYEWEL